MPVLLYSLQLVRPWWRTQMFPQRHQSVVTMRHYMKIQILIRWWNQILKQNLLAGLPLYERPFTCHNGNHLAFSTPSLAPVWCTAGWFKKTQEIQQHALLVAVCPRQLPFYFCPCPLLWPSEFDSELNLMVEILLLADLPLRLAALPSSSAPGWSSLLFDPPARGASTLLYSICSHHLFESRPDIWPQPLWVNIVWFHVLQH